MTAPVVPIRGRGDQLPGHILKRIAAGVSALHELRPGGVALVCGLPGSGKSTCAQEAIRTWPASRGRIIVWDPVGRAGRLAWQSGSRERTPWSIALGCRAVTFEQLRKSPRILDESARLVVEPDTTGASAADLQTIADQTARLTDAVRATGNVILVLDECALYGQHVRALEGLKMIATSGAHSRTSAIALSQRAGSLRIEVRSMVTTIVSGPQSASEDVDALRRRCGQVFADRVSRSPEGSPLLVWRQGGA